MFSPLWPRGRVFFTKITFGCKSCHVTYLNCPWFYKVFLQILKLIHKKTNQTQTTPSSNSVARFHSARPKSSLNLNKLSLIILTTTFTRSWPPTNSVETHAIKKPIFQTNITSLIRQRVLSGCSFNKVSSLTPPLPPPLSR